jgi:hypothetical protein
MATKKKAPTRKPAPKKKAAPILKPAGYKAAPKYVSTKDSQKKAELIKSLILSEFENENNVDVEIDLKDKNKDCYIPTICFKEKMVIVDKVKYYTRITETDLMEYNKRIIAVLENESFNLEKDDELFAEWEGSEIMCESKEITITITK